jgi:hypothetical protein
MAQRTNDEKRALAVIGILTTALTNLLLDKKIINEKELRIQIETEQKIALGDFNEDKSPSYIG